jgi:hypothetical protein
MDALNHINLGLLFPAAVAAGAIGAGIAALIVRRRP